MEANTSGYVLIRELNHSVVLFGEKIWPFLYKKKSTIFKKNSHLNMSNSYSTGTKNI